MENESWAVVKKLWWMVPLLLAGAGGVFTAHGLFWVAIVVDMGAVYAQWSLLEDK